MQRHIKNYLKFFNFKCVSECLCEVCGRMDQLDIHHIQHRQKNSPELDNVENCICVCRDCHIKAHSSILSKQQLHEIHSAYMSTERKYTCVTLPLMRH